MLRTSSRIFYVLLAPVLALGPITPAYALSLIEAVDRAVSRSPEIAGYSLQVDVARARQDLAGRGMLPQLGVDGGVGGQYSNLLGRGESSQLRRDVGAKLTQRVWDWQKTGNVVDAATRRTEVAALDVDIARDRLAFQAAQAYLNAVRGKLLLRRTQENITYHRWLVDVARERVAKNQLAKARLTELQARLSPLEVQKIDQEAELARALITLQEYAGTSSGLAIPAALPATVRPGADVEAMVDAALETHPAVRRTKFLAEAARKSLEATKAGYLPNLDANLSSRYSGDADGIRGLQWDNQAMLRVNWSLFGEGVPTQVREAEAIRDVSVAQEAQARQEVTLDVRRYAATMRALADQHDLLVEYQQAAKFSMEAGMEYIKRTARFATDMLALSDLINVRFHAESNLLNNRLDHQLAQLRLLQASGNLLPALQKAYKP